MAATDSPKTPTWRDRTENTHTAHLQEFAGRDIEVLLLGDSMFERLKTTGKGIWTTNPAVGNAGVGGDKTQHVLWRLEQGLLKVVRPKKILLMIGTNNLESHPPEDIYEGIVAIIDRIKAEAPTCHIVLLGILPRNIGDYPKGQANHMSLTSINQKLAVLPGVEYYDFGELFNEKAELYADHVHFNKSGYQIWCQQLHKLI